MINASSSARHLPCSHCGSWNTVTTAGEDPSSTVVRVESKDSAAWDVSSTRMLRLSMSWSALSPPARAPNQGRKA